MADTADITVKISFVTDAIEPLQNPYVPMHSEITSANLLVYLGIPMKKLIFDKIDAAKVSNERADFHVNIVEIIVIIIKHPKHILPFLLFGSILTKTNVLIIPIIAIAAAE